MCRKVEKLLKDLFSFNDKENPQSSNDKQSTLSILVEVEEQESYLFGEYTNPDDISSLEKSINLYIVDYLLCTFGYYGKSGDSIWKASVHQMVFSKLNNYMDMFLLKKAET
ncbi:hypothetical protein J5N97_004048 [Dioscorea zingiberensis]|uniref:Uncharacterized protein n=1 Tax=Dioscorea zingiberensis TaxID=325984 RepID=A0A9D5D794_9LILI|nr:hypothetical protein J5N97_004048 [Dioscorea zingiberensis]